MEAIIISLKNSGYNVIIPSSKIVNIEMQNEFGQIPPALIPLKGQLAIDNIIKNYPDCDTFYITIEENANMVIDYFDFFPNKRVILFKTSNSKSLNDSLFQLFSKYQLFFEKPLIVNFADTIINDLNKDLIGSNFILYSNNNESERWTLFKNRGNKITEISDRVFQLNNKNWKTFIGVFGVSNSKFFIDILSNLNSNHVNEPMFETLRNYYNKSKNLILKQTENWVDLGHIDNYYKEKEKIISHRFFNSADINTNKNRIIKTSYHKEKLIKEIEWYISIPEEMKYYIPQIYGYSLSYSNPYIEMEFYGYPSLDEAYVFSRYSLDEWNKILNNIFELIRLERKKKIYEDGLKQDIKEMYQDKTIRRVTQFLDNSQILKKEFYNSKVYINGQEADSLNYLLNNLPQLLEKYNINNIEEFNIIHGDLCLSNILYDRKFGMIKIIDPRGSFGRYTLHGDIYYELAKLSHSFLGNYDFIINGQFQLNNEKSSKQYELLVRKNDYQDMIGKIFLKYMSINGFDIQRTRFIEGLLFLSMLPLHSENPVKQKALLLNGLNILSSVLRK
jgi:hypothetical protein